MAARVGGPSRAAMQGHIGQFAVIDVDAIKKAQSGNGVWPTSGAKGVFALRAGEVVLADRETAAYDETTIKCFSALNGFGADIAAKTADPLEQWLETVSRLRVVGIAQAEDSDSTRPEQGLMVAVAGKERIFAGVQLSVGELVIVQPPVPGDSRSLAGNYSQQATVRNPTVTSAKIVPDFRPYTHFDTATELLAHFETYAADPQRYESRAGLATNAVPSPADLDRREWLESCRAVSAAQLSAGFAVLRAVLDAVAKSPTVAATLAQYLPKVDAANRVTAAGDPAALVVALATGIGLFEKDTGSDRSNVVEAARTSRRANADEWKKLGKNLHATLFPRTVKNVVAEQALVTYGLTGAAANAWQPQSRGVALHTVAGRLQDLQLNATRKLIMAVDQARMKRAERVLGKVSIGGQAGTYVQLIM